uniref:Uncharacterized protein n=1 Tax=Epichloe inebrians TaxID=2591900 RepID=I7DFZ0_9HYPO|nr:hypothetical protein [Epichloe inebrians]
MEGCLEPIRVRTTFTDDVRVFGDAVRFLLEQNDTDSLSVLASRLTPFRIDFKETLVGDALSFQPVLVFENEFNAWGDDAQNVTASSFSSSIPPNTLYNGPTIQSMDSSLMPLEGFVDNDILTERADACPACPGGAAMNRAFGSEFTHNDGLDDGLELVLDNNLVGTGDLNCQVCMRSRSEDICHVFNDAAMLGHMDDSDQENEESAGRYHQLGCSTPVGQGQQLSVQARNTSVPHVTSAVTEFHRLFGGNTTQANPASRGNDLDGNLKQVEKDCHQFLQTNLPRWVQNGVWHNHWSRSDDDNRSDSFENLQKVYSCFCQLDIRMEDDAIRSRMMMVLLHLEFERIHHDWKSGKIEGNISAVIDSILEKAHPEWHSADLKQKAEFRARFHNRKRHGKRWWILVDALGPSILLLCSPRFAGTMKNTTVTAPMIQALPAAIQKAGSKVTEVLNVVNPMAKSLFYDQGYENYAVDEILGQLKALETI